VEHLKSASLELALTLPANSTSLIKLGWKSLQVTNTLAYYENSYITDKKSFITLGPEGDKYN
jgi:hypothetical protein